MRSYVPAARPSARARWLIFLTVGLVTSLACNTLSFPLRTPVAPAPTPTASAPPSPPADTPPIPLPTSPGEASSEFRLTWTEADLTAYMASSVLPELAKRGFDVTDPQVRLRDGKITVTGVAQIGLFTLHPRVVMSPGVRAGRPVVRIESADFGPAPAPQELLDELTASINDSLAQRLPPDVTITAVIVEDGRLTLLGYLES